MTGVATATILGYLTITGEACMDYQRRDAFLDGYDDAAGRERGTSDLLEALGKALEESE